MNRIALYPLQILCFLSLFFGALYKGQAQQAADKIIGVYYVIEDESKEESKIKIYKTDDGKYDARVIWMKNPNLADGTPKTDKKNPDPNKRNQRADHLVMMQGLTYNPKNSQWENGRIYNPINGKTYKSYMEFVGDKKIKVRGYWGISMLGRTMYWTKVE
ncbi:MAG: DUF2147 domain-containing protein [Bacteroidales bacterium]